MKRKLKVSLATKFAATFVSLIMVVMLLVAFAVRKTIIDQFSSQYERQVGYAVFAVQNEFQARHKAIQLSLEQLAEKLHEDHEFRHYTVDFQQVHDPYVIDYAQNYMSTMGLQVLEITDSEGVVLSSGHYRTAFGLNKKKLIQQLKDNSNAALAWFKRADGDILCLTAVYATELGTETFYLVGGMEVNSAFLRDIQKHTSEILVLQLHNASFSSDAQFLKAANFRTSEPDQKDTRLVTLLEKEYSLGSFGLPVADGSIKEATVYLLRPKTIMSQLLSGLNQRILVITGVGILIAVILSIWLTRSVARPLRRLAITASDLSLDKLDAEFDVNGNDEVGVLNDALRTMVQRLKRSRIKLAAAEKKAVMAEIARQVNHDIKNGFVPIRNVMQHWKEVAEQEGEKLLQIFNERKATVLESLDYLENLARSYSQLRAESKFGPVNLNHLIQNLIKTYEDATEAEIRFEKDLAKTEPHVLADELQLRRAFENILRNAIEAIEGSGTISVTTEAKDGQVEISWKDTGAGIPEEIREHLFQPQVTSKRGGTGLGLVNVRNIVGDFGGTVTIESTVGKGTTIMIVFPQISNGNGGPGDKLESGVRSTAF